MPMPKQLSIWMHLPKQVLIPFLKVVCKGESESPKQIAAVADSAQGNNRSPACAVLIHWDSKCAIKGENN